MNRVKILGVNIDKVSLDQALGLVEGWVKKGGKHYIVTPNIEFVIAAQKDREFLRVLNEADLAIPDSARLGWASKLITEKNFFKKVLFWPLFLTPKFFNFPVTTGTDLMEKIVEKSIDWTATVGFIGGDDMVAERLKECLLKKYPNLKISFVESGGRVDYDGNSRQSLVVSRQKIDILFVAFGHIKQEKWISKNLKSADVKVMIGVGGAFDYLSGGVVRAPKLVRDLGFEWLFRLAFQPSRIKRFGSLVKFILTVPFSRG